MKDMHKDSNNRDVSEGDFVQILQVDPSWFNYESKTNYQILQSACLKPVKVDYLDDNGWLSLILPPTMDDDGEYLSNSIYVHSKDVTVCSNAS